MQIRTVDKLKYLIVSEDGDKVSAGKFIRISNFKMNQVLTQPETISANIEQKINKAFNDRLMDEVLFRINSEYRNPDIQYVKNYDFDESLLDLKTQNSKHGSNKGSRAHSGHN